MADCNVLSRVPFVLKFASVTLDENRCRIGNENYFLFHSSNEPETIITVMIHDDLNDV